MSRNVAVLWCLVPPPRLAQAAARAARAASLLVVVGHAGVGATEPLPDPPIYSAPHVDPRPDGMAGLTTPNGGVRRIAPGVPADDGRAQALLPPRRVSTTLIEMPADYRPAGARSRPHHAIGFRSTATEGWLREQGIDARQCYLPMLRARARLTPSGETSAAFWIYARCSIQ